jgi:hypothetical protein
MILLRWIFKLFPYEDQELLQYYRIVDRYAPCHLSILEYAEEEDDIAVMFQCAEILKIFHLEGSTAKGKYSRRDLAASNEVSNLLYLNLNNSSKLNHT